ncbi:hypothetical protein [Psychromonas antarctica]|uniref:hypothetical protein n=1 Tax=Psychromonas antarctica TaxID=67573 RepID=UPI001EE78D53|nr:hypothetical protein [Psychromonas antarctica]MCG6202030.1 hypothetical protein [Psychromonas antarctica]
MKQCPTIINITFDEESLKGIEYIKSVGFGLEITRYALIMGHLNSIFGGSSIRNVSKGSISGMMNAIPNETVKTVVKTTGKVVSSEVSQTAYSITTANWFFFIDALGELPQIKRELIEKAAGFQALAHQTSPKERLFWRSIHNGCSMGTMLPNK